MSAAAKPAEGARIRFSTPNPWDDPLFRSAIRGREREQRRAEMQASIERVLSERGRPQKVDPIGEAPAALVTSDATGARSERWACPGCSWSSDKASAIATHKKSCAGLYERRRNESQEHAAARAKVDALLADPKTVVVSAFNEPAPPIQADTPPAPPAYPTGQPAAPTVAAEEGETMTAIAGAPKKVKALKMPKYEPVKGPRICGCARTGSHKATCKLAVKADAAPLVCACGRTFPTANGLNGHRRACKGAAAPSPCRAGSVVDRAAKGDKAAQEELALPEPWIPQAPLPSLRCLVVRVRGAVPLEVECATPEDAAAFVRLVSQSRGAKTEARG